MTHTITDARHFVDEKGAIGPKDGIGCQMAEFFGHVIANVTISVPHEHSAQCFKCSNEVHASVAVTGYIEWVCSDCDATGYISNWQGTFWDLTTKYET